MFRRMKASSRWGTSFQGVVFDRPSRMRVASNLHNCTQAVCGIPAHSAGMYDGDETIQHGASHQLLSRQLISSALRSSLSRLHVLLGEGLIYRHQIPS